MQQYVEWGHRLLQWGQGIRGCEFRSMCRHNCGSSLIPRFQVLSPCSPVEIVYRAVGSIVCLVGPLAGTDVHGEIVLQCRCHAPQN